MSCPALTLTRHDCFASLRSGWDALLTHRSANPIFLTSAWQEHCWRTNGEGELHLLSVEAGPELVGIAPIVHARDAIEPGRRAFDFLPSDEPYEYDLAARDVPILELRVRLGADAAARSDQYV